MDNSRTWKAIFLMAWNHHEAMPHQFLRFSSVNLRCPWIEQHPITLPGMRIHPPSHRFCPIRPLPHEHVGVLHSALSWISVDSLRSLVLRQQPTPVNQRACNIVLSKLTLPSSVFFTQPVNPNPLACFSVKDLWISELAIVELTWHCGPTENSRLALCHELEKRS